MEDDSINPVVGGVITGCGGSSAVARHFGIRPQAVSQWLTGGVPIRRVLELVTLAKSMGQRITEHDLRPDVFPAPRKRSRK